MGKDRGLMNDCLEGIAEKDRRERLRILGWVIYLPGRVRAYLVLPRDYHVAKGLIMRWCSASAPGFAGLRAASQLDQPHQVAASSPV